jgi:1-acyl-sn-glycerol-3-phosphate acyltransferase
VADQDKAPAKKTAKKVPAKKVPAKKVSAKKVPAKKVPANESVERPEPARGAVPKEDATGGERGAVASPVDSVITMLIEFAGSLLRDFTQDRARDAVEFLRRRLTGEYDVDVFGFDPDFTETVLLPIVRPLYKSWFRVECRGVENIPADGGALVVANHSGTIPMDSLMTQVAVHDRHPQRRHLRMLGADLVFQLPVIADLARKSGTTLACNEDALRLLRSGELVGVWPEGFKGVGKPFSERYRLQRFGRGGFVTAAVRSGTPIVPCSIVGAEEIYPMIGNIKPLARLLGIPYVPVTPTFPWLGPLGLVPLPSKWIIEFNEPIHTHELDPVAAEDPMVVFDLNDRVRDTIQRRLDALVAERGNPFG